MTIEENKNLAEFTTFKIGGVARHFVRVASVADAVEAVGYAKKSGLPVFVLGGGSNVLISDTGFPGLVIKNEIKGIKLKDRYITAGAGEVWDDVVQATIKANFEGLECLSGIPGTLGGAVVQNVGAYGQSLNSSIDIVEAIDLADGQLKEFGRHECQFEYRNSIFKKNPGRFLVTAAILKLEIISRPNIAYHALKNYFQGKPEPSIEDVRQAVIWLRAAKGMVIMKGYEAYYSAGSYFKNPLVPEENLDKLKRDIKCTDPWFWLEREAVVKVSAACLISSAGFKKGQLIDGAQISPRHTLGLINPGSATAKEIKAASEKIKKQVHRKFGIMLEEEVVYVGKFV